MTRHDLAERAATTLTRVLLLLYPPSFRKDVGNALVGDVARRAQEMAGSQTSLRIGFWLVRLTASLLVNAIAAWGEQVIPCWRRNPGSPRDRSWAVGSTFSWLDLKLAVRMLVVPRPHLDRRFGNRGRRRDRRRLLRHLLFALLSHDPAE